jgi:hypothetical protein
MGKSRLSIRYSVRFTSNWPIRFRFSFVLAFFAIEVRIGEHLSHEFLIQNGLKQGDACNHYFWYLVWNTSLSKSFQFNGMYRLLIYVDNVNIVGET